MERHFDRELLNLKKLLLDMASLVEELIAQAVEALAERDSVKGRALLPRDEQVDVMEIAIDEAAMRLLALRQPMAVDLRLIASALEIAKDLERMGDLAQKLARVAVELGDHPPLAPPAELPRLSRLVQGMVRDSIDAFVRRDASLASEVILRDDEIDDLRRSIISALKEAMSQGRENIDAGVAFILGVNALERVADHATNVAEDVVYLVEGEVVKHHHRPLPLSKGASRPATPGPR